MHPLPIGRRQPVPHLGNPIPVHVLEQGVALESADHERAIARDAGLDDVLDDPRVQCEVFLKRVGEGQGGDRLCMVVSITP
jgi:hypothetical protein